MATGGAKQNLQFIPANPNSGGYISFFLNLPSIIDLKAIFEFSHMCLEVAFPCRVPL